MKFKKLIMGITTLSLSVLALAAPLSVNSDGVPDSFFGKLYVSASAENDDDESLTHQHTYTSEITTEPTCTTDGIVTYTCECGDSYTEPISATGHSYEQTVVDPTYAEEGYTLHTCSVCGDSFKDSYTSKLVLDSITDLSMTSNLSTSITMSWSEVYDATAYVVYQVIDGKWERIKITTDNSLTVSNLKSGTNYRFTVRAYRTFEGKNYYSSSYTSVWMTTAPAKPSAKMSSNTTSSVKLSWNKVDGATGYAVFRYFDNGWKKIKSTTATSYTVSNLSAGTDYKFAVRAYRTFNGKNYYSPFSESTCTIKTCTKPAQVNFRLTSKPRRATVSWDKVTGATGYIVYYKASKTDSWKRLAVTKETSFTKTNLRLDKTYYFTVRAYKKLGGVNYYSTYTAKTVKIKTSTAAGNVLKYFKNDVEKAGYVIRDDLNKILTSYKQSKSITVTNSDFKVSDSRKKKIMSLINSYASTNTSSFVLLDIRSGAMISYNADWYVPTASTVKAPYICYVLSQEIDTGNASLSDVITYQKKHYKTGSGVIQYCKFGTKFTIREIIEKILYYSDNVGYYMLQDYFGVDNYNKWLESLGCKTFINGTTLKWGYVSARDSAKIWTEIYKYIHSGKYGDFFLSELLTTGYSPIRNSLGDRYDVANKFGGADIGWHDTGIVFKNNNPYILILLTNDSYRHADYYFQNNMIKQLDALHDELVKFNNK